MAVAYYELLVQEDCAFGIDTVVKRNPGGGSLTGTEIGIHSMSIGQAAVTSTWNPGEVAAGGSVSTTITVPGAELGDFVLRSFSLDIQGLTFTADVVSANTVKVTLANLTGSAIDLASGTLRVVVMKSR